MQTIYCDELEEVIKLEYEKMVKYNVIQVLKLSQVPKGTKLMDFIWAMKSKPSRIY